MLGDAMVSKTLVQVTCEEVPRGTIPGWLKEHISRQSLGPTESESDLSGRVLIVYPTEESRKQALAVMPSGQAIDSTLHHTIDSLKSSLIADLRLPRLLNTEGGFELVLHESCRREAARLAFPIINPLPEMRWGRGKTAALAELHSYLSRESMAVAWDGPGIPSFRTVIRQLENRLGGTHPDMASSRIIDGLNSGEKPFSLLDIDGIIMLDHPPEVPRSHIQIMLALSRHCPIHQLAHPGNFRLGHHGMSLLDQHPIEAQSDLPLWVPPHQPESTNPVQSVERLLLQREKHSFETAIWLTQERLEAGSSSHLIIVDPSLESNLPRWERGLKELGIPLPPSRQPVLTHSLGHWILALATLPHGPDAFSLEALRSLALQATLRPFNDPDTHPTEGRISPRADPDMLTHLARGEHVLGGPGALARWLQTISRPPISERDQFRKESTQWWLLCVADSLRPLLRGEDRTALDEVSRMGCHTGQGLPTLEPSASGDDWLLSILGMMDLESAMESCDGGGPTPAAVVQTVLRDLRELRSMQSSLGHSVSEMGPDWVEEFTSLTHSSSILSSASPISGRVRVLTPAAALGCSADTIILANLSSSSWDLSAPKMPFLGDEERHSLDLLRPDGPIRDARHQLEHLLAAAPEVLVLDSSLDDASPAAAPIREWAAAHDPDDDAEVICTEPEQPVSPRGLRQADGASLRNMLPSVRPPLNPSAISISMDSELQRDRERRQPIHADDDGYLAQDSAQHLLSIDRTDLIRRVPTGIEPPRSNDRWPVVGGLAAGGKRTPTIDPRPFSLLPTGADVSDSRHGHSTGAEQDVPVWSPSRLHYWLKCPRMGWLSNGLRAEQDELQPEDLDPRTHGELLHNVHHDLICQTLGFEIGTERSLGEGSSVSSVALSGMSENEIMRTALESLDSRAPWLDRTDAVSTHRLMVLTGMNREEWNQWLANPGPVPPLGRVGTIVRAESAVRHAAPVCLEWSMTDFDEAGVEISIPTDIAGGEELSPIRVRGFIDRVDILPIDETSQEWLDSDGDESIAPLRVHGSGWRPRRLVAIRDLKTSESKAAKIRHFDGLLDELQLALYARAWEIAHPGDLVVAAGISLFSHYTEHMLEMSTQYSTSHENLQIGTRTDITTSLHRFPDEAPSSHSDHFRAWLTQRLAVALRVAAGAAAGRVHPTPSSRVCGYCPVRNVCEVRTEAGF